MRDNCEVPLVIVIPLITYLPYPYHTLLHSITYILGCTWSIRSGIGHVTAPLTMSGKKDIPPQPDQAGLEVDHTRDKGYAAPEVYEKTPSYPEPVVLLKYPADLVSPEVIDSPDGVWYANGQTGNGYGHGQHGQYPYAHARGMPYEGMEVGEQPKSPWWRRKRGIFAITAVAVVVVIAIVVGAVMGTRCVFFFPLHQNEVS